MYLELSKDHLQVKSECVRETWSLVAHLGAPFWYITLSPADIKHPICLYYAGTNERFKPEILPYDE